MLLIKSQHIDEPLNLDELMMYSLTPVPHSLGTPDGFFNKTNKAAMLHFLTEDVVEDVPYPKDKTLFIQDGNALFHALTNLPPTFGAICLQVLDQMVAKTDFVFSTDSYHAKEPGETTPWLFSAVYRRGAGNKKARRLQIVPGKREQ